MPTLECPSTTFPGRPSLGLPLPSGWEAAPEAAAVPGVVLAAVRPQPAGELHANLVVRLDEVPAGHTPLVDLEAVAVRASQVAEGCAGPPYTRDIGGLTFFGRDLSHRDEAAGTILVSTLFGYLRRSGDDGGLVRVTMTGTIGSYRPREDYVELHRLIDGLDVTPAPGTTPVRDEEQGR